MKTLSLQGGRCDSRGPPSNDIGSGEGCPRTFVSRPDPLDDGIVYPTVKRSNEQDVHRAVARTLSIPYTLTFPEGLL